MPENQKVKMIKPPETKRYCTICQRMNWYAYDNIIGHSYCKRCGRGSLFARKQKPLEVMDEKHETNQIVSAEWQNKQNEDVRERIKQQLQKLTQVKEDVI